MAAQELWKSDESSNGIQVIAALDSGGLLVTLHRKIVAFQGENEPAATTRFIHTRLIVFWPSAIEETMRVVSHWLDFYDPALKSNLAELAKKLSGIPESTATRTTPPQGTTMN
jgi:hypothetical protein